MPKVVARTIITNKLKKMYDLPIIYFSFDEHSGTEGMRTRLEAFVDLMESRRKHKLKKENISFEDDRKNFYKNNGSHFFHECVKLIQT
jgi:predicted nucleotide-binding protein (sugar kinase/HSP70/actin superfamily)